MDVPTLRGGPVGARAAHDVATTAATARAQTFESLTALPLIREGMTAGRARHRCDIRPADPPAGPEPSRAVGPAGQRRIASQRRGPDGPGHRRPRDQCAASRQVRPMPTPTSSGTDSW